MTYNYKLNAAIFILGMALVLGVNSCTSKKEPEVKAPEKIETPIVSNPSEKIQLSWEDKHPERSEWTKEMITQVVTYLDTLSKAEDITRICPKFSSMDEAYKVLVMSEIMVGVSWAETDGKFNPKDESVDVGEDDDKNTWSVGLFQISVIDQEAYHIPLGLKYADLLTPIKNIDLGVALMADQIKNRGGKIIMKKGDKGIYWAVILDNGKYQRIDEVVNRVVGRVPACK